MKGYVCKCIPLVNKFVEKLLGLEIPVYLIHAAGCIHSGCVALSTGCILGCCCKRYIYKFVEKFVCLNGLSVQRHI